MRAYPLISALELIRSTVAGAEHRVGYGGADPSGALPSAGNYLGAEKAQARSLFATTAWGFCPAYSSRRRIRATSGRSIGSPAARDPCPPGAGDIGETPPPRIFACLL